MIKAESLQQILHNEIPLSQAMGISVQSCQANQLILSAPLEANINHKCTAFGGSLYSIAVLCGWGFIYAALASKKLEGHIVIYKSDIHYHIPVDGELLAVCDAPDKKKMDRFLTTYTRRKRARLKLNIRVMHQQHCAVEFNGEYVVHD